MSQRLRRSCVRSPDGTTYTTVAIGTYIDDASLKTTTFTPVNARYVRIQALSEAGGRGPYTSIAEINVYTAAFAAPPAPTAGKGEWVLTVDFPLVPVSLAHEWSTGTLLAWSSYTPSSFGGSPGTTTYTATYNPGSGLVTQAIISNIDHDMFCEGLSLDFNGKIISTGGNTDAATSTFDPTSQAWTALAVSIPLCCPCVVWGALAKVLCFLEPEHSPRLPSPSDYLDRQRLYDRSIMEWR